MTDSMLEQLIASYQSLPFEPRQYIYAWQGGEPTLAGLDFFRRIVSLQQKHGLPGTMVSNALQTNAMVINAEWARFLADYRFLTGVSMDGPAAFHDLYRRTVAGGPSHEQVLNATRLLRDYKAEFNILCLVSQSNIRSAKAVFNYFFEQGFHWLQFIPCVEVDENGKQRPFAISGEAWGDFLCELFDAWVPHRYTVSIRLFDALISKLGLKQNILCQLDTHCHQYLTIEHSGDIFPCDFFVTQPYGLGNIVDDGLLSVWNGKQLGDFACMKSQLPGKCKHCKHLQICNADCLKHRILPPNHTPGQLTHLCAGLKRFYDYTVPKFQKMGDEVRIHRSGVMS